MSKLEEKVNEILGIDKPEPSKEIVKQEFKPAVPRKEDDKKADVDNDYKYSRDTYYELVEKGKQSLELMIEVARESEHPRAFEVLSGMIKNISDVNDRLMDLNIKRI